MTATNTSQCSGRTISRRRWKVVRPSTSPMRSPPLAAVTLTAFENVYNEGLNGNPHQKAEPSRATQLHQSLSENARASVPVESYEDGVEEVRRLGQLLPVEDAQSRGGRTQTRDIDSWRVSSRRECGRLTVRADDGCSKLSPTQKRQTRNGTS
jgi:hypothetical protein